MTPSSTRRRLLSAVSLALVGGVAGCSGTADEGDGTPEPPDSDASDESGDGLAAATATTSTPEREEPTTEDGTDPPPTETPAGATASPQGDDSTATLDDELDLREANVVAVAVAVDGSGSYRFDVTLFHDDDGEPGYADWWQVETLAGERLGRRTLLHAHSTAPFTRSAQLTVPEDTTYVVVRGHDQTHGYGGQAMVVNVATGDSEAVRQGPEPRDFSAFEPRV